MVRQWFVEAQVGVSSPSSVLKLLLTPLQLIRIQRKIVHHDVDYNCIHEQSVSNKVVNCNNMIADEMKKHDKN